MASVIVTGVKKIDAKMADIIPNMQKKAIRKALRASAKIVRTDLDALVPEDTGLLSTTSRVRARRRSRKARIGVDIIIGSDTVDEDSPYYALFLEFGHVAVDGTFVDGQPFARPALWDNRPRVSSVFLAELRQWLRQFANK